LSTHYDAVSTDLGAYRAKGGKLIIWHGYNDSAVSAYHTRDYVDAVTARYGASQASEFLRTYLAPWGEPLRRRRRTEPDQMNLLATMVEWVEKGTAPTSVMASHRTSGVVDRTMPLCPYPQVARYKGTGDIKVGGELRLRSALTLRNP
jgi:feruloyl esterase